MQVKYSSNIRLRRRLHLTTLRFSTGHLAIDDIMVLNSKIKQKLRKLIIAMVLTYCLCLACAGGFLLAASYCLFQTFTLIAGGAIPHHPALEVIVTLALLFSCQYFWSLANWIALVETFSRRAYWTRQISPVRALEELGHWNPNMAEKFRAGKIIT